MASATMNVVISGRNVTARPPLFPPRFLPRASWSWEYPPCSCEWSCAIGPQ